MKKIFLAATFILICISTTIFAMSKPKKQSIKPLMEYDLKITKNDIVLGSTNAPISIIEYSSLSCPHCAKFHTEILPDIKKLFIDTNKANFVHRDFPLNKPALKGTMLADCIDKDNYYKFIKLLFSEQDDWAFKKNYEDLLKNYAKLLGMKNDKIESCLNDKDSENKIAKELEFAHKNYDVNSTPTFFVNGEKYDSASMMKNYKSIINSKLKN